MDDSVEDGIAFFGALDQTESLAENRSAGTGIGGMTRSSMRRTILLSVHFHSYQHFSVD